MPEIGGSATTSSQGRTSENLPEGSGRRWLRRKMTLSFYLTAVCAVSASAACMLIGYYAYDHLKENKFRDAWAITFLELEKQVSKINQTVSGFDDSRSQVVFEGNVPKQITRPPDVSLHVLKNRRLSFVKGNLRGLKSLDQLGIERLGRRPRFTILQFAGRNYLSVFSGKKNQPVIDLYEIDLVKVIAASQDLNKDSTVYLITREGKLVYTNDLAVTADSLVSRPLLQEFISIPVRQGQLRFESREGEDFYGFYSEIPETNLVLFAETPERVFITKILEIAEKFSLPVGIIILTVLLVLQISLRGVSRPVRDLLRLATEVSRGNFKVRASVSGFGELNALSTTFTQMAESLVARDESIRDLMSQQKEKVRLESEMEIAREIQENLLPKNFSEEGLRLEIDTLYQPADTVAGDWYGRWHNPDSNEYLMAIADVSGHGAGPSIFTAIISAIFEEHKILAREKFDMNAFFSNLNKILQRIGRGKWHATMQVVIYSPDRLHIDLYNCGHNFPFLIPSMEGERKKVEMVKLRSTPLGVTPDLTIAHKRLEIDREDTLLLYTDGLIEARNRANAFYGAKRLVKLFERTPDTSPRNLIRVIHRDYEAFSRGTIQGDDICLIAMQVS